MEETEESFLTQFTAVKAVDGSDCTDLSVIIARTHYIPSDFKISSIIDFLGTTHFLFIAIERIQKDNAIVIGFTEPVVTPEFATDFLCFLVMSRIRPELYITKCPSYDIKDFLDEVHPPNVEVFPLAEASEDAPPPEPVDVVLLPETAKKPQEEVQTWADRWNNMKRSEWDDTRMEVSVSWINDIEANLGLFKRRLVYEDPTPLKHSTFRTSNLRLGIPPVEAKTLELLAAHQSVFE